MVKVGVRDQNGVNVFRAQANLSQYLRWAVPGANVVPPDQSLAVVLVVNTDVDHNNVATAFNDDVPIRHSYCALIMRAPNQPTDRALQDSQRTPKPRSNTGTSLCSV